MEDKIDFNLLNNKAIITPSSYNGYFDYYYTYTDEYNNEILIMGNKVDGFIRIDSPPKPIFHKTYREYYPSGYLSVKGIIVWGSYTRINTLVCYDEQGNQVFEIDENAKFGEFDYEKLLTFLHLNEHINLETGENRERLVIGYDETKKHWFASITNIFYMITEYILDGETGKVIDKKEYQGGRM